MNNYSNEYKKYLKFIKRNNTIIFLVQIFIFICFIFLWQYLSSKNYINSFLLSSPYKIIVCIIDLLEHYNLFSHIYTTFIETIISFLLSNTIGLFIGSILWWSKPLSRILEPYLTILNSLPKVALGPLIIIWVGASQKSIIVMSLSICLIISIINIYSSFLSTDNNYIILLKTLNASKLQIFIKAIIPSNISNIINIFKVNISMSLIGVIIGELLVSKKGLGYLIMYGSQVFNINLVMSSVFILGILSYLIYFIIHYIEKKLTIKS